MRMGCAVEGKRDRTERLMGVRKHQKQRILPIRTSTAFHQPGPADSPMVIPPEPPTLTPAESDDGDDEARGMRFAYASPLGLPSIMAEAPDDDQRGLGGDCDMMDSLPMHSPDGMSRVSPYTIPQRIPTPRYGGFFLRSAASSLREDPAMMQHDEERIVQAMGMSSLNRSLDSRMLPSPINEGERYSPSGLRPAPRSGRSNRQRPTYPGPADENTRMDLGSPALPVEDGATMREPQGRLGQTRTGGSGAAGGKPMLVMGYRADCEKCKARVPGHYSHIIRSS